jgi:DnaJ-class molecular chaperone
MTCLATLQRGPSLTSTATKVCGMEFRSKVSWMDLSSSYFRRVNSLTVGDDVAKGYTYKQNAKEIFESFFGSSNPFAAFGFGDSMPFASRLNKPGPKPSEPVVYNLECSLPELYNGCTKKFNVTRKRFSADGQLLDDTKQLTINVRPGWKKGTRVTFPGEGDESKTATTPDVVFVIQEKADPAAGYQREGNDLMYTCKLSLADALSDCSLMVPTLDKRLLSFPCPEVVSPYYEKRIPGKISFHVPCSVLQICISRVVTFANTVFT